jgi:hypothetical protein
MALLGNLIMMMMDHPEWHFVVLARDTIHGVAPLPWQACLGFEHTVQAAGQHKLYCTASYPAALYVAPNLAKKWHTWHGTRIVNYIGLCRMPTVHNSCKIRPGVLSRAPFAVRYIGFGTGAATVTYFYAKRIEEAAPCVHMLAIHYA